MTHQPGWRIQAGCFDSNELRKISFQYGFVGSKMPVGEVTRSGDENHK
jgi:hypothetical protein